MGIVPVPAWGRGVTGNVGVWVVSADGEAEADGVATGSGVSQAAASKASMVNRKASFFIGWVLLLHANISELPQPKER